MLQIAVTLGSGWSFQLIFYVCQLDKRKPPARSLALVVVVAHTLSQECGAPLPPLKGVKVGGHCVLLDQEEKALSLRESEMSDEYRFFVY